MAANVARGHGSRTMVLVGPTRLAHPKVRYDTFRDDVRHPTWRGSDCLAVCWDHVSWMAAILLSMVPVLSIFLSECVSSLTVGAAAARKAVAPFLLPISWIFGKCVTYGIGPQSKSEWS
jgi:hypothetical protein